MISYIQIYIQDTDELTISVSEIDELRMVVSEIDELKIFSETEELRISVPGTDLEHLPSLLLLRFLPLKVFLMEILLIPGITNENNYKKCY